MKEEWKTIPSIQTHEVSNLGNIRSIERISNINADGLFGHNGDFD